VRNPDREGVGPKAHAIFLTSRPLEEAGRESKRKSSPVAGDGNASGADERHATRRRGAGTLASIEHGKAVPGRWRLVVEGAGAPAPSLLFPTAQLNGFRAKERRCGDVLSAVNGQIQFFRAMLFTWIRWRQALQIWVINGRPRSRALLDCACGSLRRKPNVFARWSIKY